MSEKNCTTCLKAVRKEKAAGRSVWHCPENDINVNARMHCDGGSWPMERPFVGAVSVSGITRQKTRLSNYKKR